MLIWSLLPDEEPNPKLGFGAPNTGCDGVADAGELKGKEGPDETLEVDPNTMGALLVPVLEVAPKANNVEEEEDGVELNPVDFGACQLEPNTADAGLAMELTELDSEVEELSPNVVPELNNLDVEEPNVELPEEKAELVVKLKGIDAGELNCFGMLCVEVAKPVPAAET
jgi:hypothetical protein